MIYSITIKPNTLTGEVVTAANTLEVIDLTAWGAVVPVLDVRIYSPSGVLFYESLGLSKGFILSDIAMPVDVDSNIINGAYTIKATYGLTQDTETFTYTYTPEVKLPVAEANGYASTFEARDSNDYTTDGWSVTRTLKVVPPVGSGMPDYSTSAAVISIPANIYAGTYTVGNYAWWYKGELQSGNYVRISDASAEEITVDVYNLDTDTVYDEVNTYFAQYNTYLSTSPKQALLMQPVIMQVFNALHRYYRYVEESDSLNAYEQLLYIYQLLNPDYESETIVVEEITPFEILGSNHTHTNLVEILAKFTLEGGSLYFDGTEIPLSISLGKSALTDGGALKYLDEWVDDTTLQSDGTNLKVKEHYIASLADEVTIFYNYITHKFSTSETEAGYGINWIPTRTYQPADIVSVIYEGLTLYFVCLQESTDESPVNQGTPQGVWELDTNCLLRHAQNTDLYIPYITSTKSAANLGETIDGRIGFNLVEIGKNRFIWTKTGNVAEEVYSIILPHYYADVVLTIKATGLGAITLKNTGSTYSFKGQLDLQGDDIVIASGEEYTFTLYAHLAQAAYITNLKSTTKDRMVVAQAEGNAGDVQLNDGSDGFGVAATGIGKYHGEGAWTFGTSRTGVVGAGSFVAGGGNNEASAASSVALGGDNVASAQAAVALGRANTASGIAAIAMGRDNTASGTRSVAAGYTNAVSGDYSTGIGSNNTVAGAYCEVGGASNTVNAGDTYGEVHGAQNTILNTDYAEVHGRSNEAVDGAYVEIHGYDNTVDGSYSEVHGTGNTLDVANYSEVHGKDNTASADYTEVHGLGATATEIGEYARSAGYITEVGDAQERVIQLRGRVVDSDRAIRLTPDGIDTGVYGLTIPASTVAAITVQFALTVEATEHNAFYTVNFGAYTTVDTVYISALSVTGGDFNLGLPFTDYFAITTDGLMIIFEMIGQETDRSTRGMATIRMTQLKKIT